MKKVEFIEVGRNKNSWTAETKGITYDWLYKQVKIRGQIMSDGIDFSDDGGIFVGGFRKVGSFKVVENES